MHHHRPLSFFTIFFSLLLCLTLPLSLYTELPHPPVSPYAVVLKYFSCPARSTSVMTLEARAMYSLHVWFLCAEGEGWGGKRRVCQAAEVCKHQQTHCTSGLVYVMCTAPQSMWSLLGMHGA